jgi:hypothetical protein
VVAGLVPARRHIGDADLQAGASRLRISGPQPMERTLALKSLSQMGKPRSVNRLQRLTTRDIWLIATLTGSASNMQAPMRERAT